MPPITPGVHNERPGPSTDQQRLWFLSRMEPQSAAYNIVGGCRLRGPLDRDALRRSLAEIVRRQQALRTNIVEADGAPVTALRDAGDWTVEVRSLAGLPPQDRERELAAIALAESQRPFDLAADILIRASLVELAEDDHVQLVAIHHVAADGWSLGVFCQEFCELYAAFAAGLPSPLPELPVQYSDFVRWRSEHIESRVALAQIDYWKHQLRPPLPATELPTDRPRPPKATYRGRRLRQMLPEGLRLAVERVSAAEQVTPFVTLLAAFNILLYRYTRECDVVVGTASAGRARPELEKLIGLFMNNLVLRSDLSGDPTFRELLARQKETVLGAFAHEHVSLDRLTRTLNPNRELNRSPFFQIMFILQNYPLRTVEIANLRIEPYEFDAQTARMDLTVEAQERDGGLALEWEFNTGLFDAATIERLQQHYRLLLEGAIEAPGKRLSELRMLTAAEASALAAAADARIEYPRALCVHDWIERQADSTPDALAVICGEERLTYRDLSSRSNSLARRLRSMGVTAETLVAVLVDRSASMVVALLAIWKAGGAYVPLDPQYPRNRLAFMLADSRAAVLITETNLLPSLPAEHPPALCLDRKDEWMPESGAALERFAAPHNLAYVIYTSGSTGKPKGVAVEHRSLVNFLASMSAEPGANAFERLLAVTTLSFDIAGLEIYLPLITGGAVVLASRNAASDPAALAALLRDSEITTMQATPVTWRALLDSGWQGETGLKILCGGEPLPRDLANRLLDAGAELWNLYGPTETTVWSTVQKVTSRSGPVPIGHPIANTATYLLDEHLQPSPPGAVGELYIAGDGLAREYLRRPELTAKAFIDNPFAPGGRLYRTGDLARRLPGGELECLGRADHQVKLRGFRIELSEIEAALERQPSIQQAAVVKDEGSGTARLVAYVVARDRAAADPAILRKALAAELPDYMVPAAFVALDAFPLTPNKKIDRKALPAPDAAALSPSGFYAPPATDLERKVAAIWQELLGLPRVGAHDNFFDLGGHSLLVIQLQSRLRRSFRRELSVIELFQHPTVSAIADLLSQTPAGPAPVPGGLAAQTNGVRG